MVEIGIKGHPETFVTTVSVATNFDVSHCSATHLRVAIDRRKVTFSVKAYDERGLVGEGTHERFIIDIDKFIAKATSK